jgi:uncharacterized protein YjdB
LPADIFPRNATNRLVLWVTSDRNIASLPLGQGNYDVSRNIGVTAKTTITARSPGTATILAKIEQFQGNKRIEITDTCEVTVVIPVTGISINAENGGW